MRPSIILLALCLASGKSGDGANSGDDGANTTDGGSDGTDDPGTLTVWTSSTIALPADRDGALHVACPLWTDAGVEASDATVTIAPATGVTDTDGVWTFTDTGAYTVT